MVDLTQQEPGYSVLAELHRLQSPAPPLSAPARFLGLNPLKPKAVAWYQGYLGELRVGAVLNHLRAKGYTVLHGVTVGSGDTDVDHIVITPTGYVHTFNTKHHAGKRVWIGRTAARVNGQDVPHVRNLRSETKRVQRHLDQRKVHHAGLESALVFVGQRELQDQAGGAVTVLRLHEVTSHIERRERKRASLNPVAFDAAPLADSGFWQSAYDAQEFAQQGERLAWFAKLHRAMVRRATVKLAWGLLITALLVGAGLGLARLLMSA